MSWQLLILISVILYSVSVLLQRLILKEDQSQPIAYSIFFQLITGLIIGIVGFFLSPMSLPSNLIDLIWNLVLMTILYGFSNILIFKSLKEIEASKFTVVFATRAFFTVLGSSLLLKEFLSGSQFLGAACIFLGVVIINLHSVKLKLDRGSLLALGAAMAFGFANTNDRYLLTYFDVYPYVTIGFLLPPLLISIVYPRELKHFKLFIDPKVLGKILLLSVVYAFSAIAFFAALQISNNSSQVASINLTSVIITVILSVVFLKERKQLLKKLSAATIALLGLLLLS